MQLNAFLTNTLPLHRFDLSINYDSSCKILGSVYYIVNNKCKLQFSLIYDLSSKIIWDGLHKHTIQQNSKEKITGKKVESLKLRHKTHSQRYIILLLAVSKFEFPRQ